MYCYRDTTLKSEFGGNEYDKYAQCKIQIRTLNNRRTYLLIASQNYNFCVYTAVIKTRNQENPSTRVFNVLIEPVV